MHALLKVDLLSGCVWRGRTKSSAGLKLLLALSKALG